MGDFYISGVAKPGARVKVDFLQPAGSKTGKLLPTDQPLDILDIPGYGQIKLKQV